MKQLQLILCVLAFTMTNLALSAQDLLKYVPADVAMLAGLNPNTLKAKMNVDRVRKMEFYDFMIQEMKKGAGLDQQEILSTLVQDPRKYGMKLYDQSYLFANVIEGGGLYVNYLFKLSDLAAFEKFLDDEILPQGKLSARKMKSYSILIQDEAAIAWNDEVLLVTGVTQLPDFEGEDLKQFKGHVTDRIEQRAEQILNPGGSPSVLTNANFLKAGAGRNSDAFFWIDYSYFGQLNEMMGNRLNQNPLTGAMMDQMMELYQDNYVMMDLSFLNGKISLDTKYLMNEEMEKIIAGMTDASINPRFARYLPREDLLGYFAMALNVEKTIKGFAELAKPAMGEEMPDVDQLIGEAVKAVGLNMSAEEVYQLFKGDLIIAFTGLREFQKEVSTYEYDEDFNRTEVKKLQTETLPEMTMMMSYNDEDDLMPLIQMGIDASMLERSGNYYKVNVPTSPVDMFLAMRKGVLLLTNNPELITTHLKRGLKKKYRLGKSHLTAMISKSQIFYWDINRTLDELAEIASAAGGPAGDQLVALGRQNMESLWYAADKAKNGMFEASVELNMTNDEINALEQLFELINDLYLSFSNEQRM